jgi:beta-glucosidase-like glycosyl hydrolase
LKTARAEAAAVPAKWTSSVETAEPAQTVSRLLLTRFAGTSPTEPPVLQVASALRTGLVSGVVFSPENVQSPEQVRALTRAFGEAAGDRPLIIAIAQSGGQQPDLPQAKGFASYASPKSVAENQDPLDAQVFYEDMAAELSDLGFTLNFGPTAGGCSASAPWVQSCFSESSVRSAAYAAAFSFAHRSRQMLAAMSYHTDTVVADVAGRGQAANAAIALLRTVISRQRIPDALLIAPDTQSLGTRDRPDFEGAVIADVSQVNAGTVQDAAIEALKAGADLIILPAGHDSPLIDAASDAIRDAMAKGELPNARIAEATGRANGLLGGLKRSPPLASQAVASAQTTPAARKETR